MRPCREAVVEDFSSLHALPFLVKLHCTDVGSATFPDFETFPQLTQIELVDCYCAQELKKKADCGPQLTVQHEKPGRALLFCHPLRMPGYYLSQLSLLKVLAILTVDSEHCPKLAGLTALEALSLGGFRENEDFMLKISLQLTSLRWGFSLLAGCRWMS